MSERKLGVLSRIKSAARSFGWHSGDDHSLVTLLQDAADDIDWLEANKGQLERRCLALEALARELANECCYEGPVSNVERRLAQIRAEKGDG